MRAATMLLWSQWRQTGWYTLAGALIAAFTVIMVHLIPEGANYVMSRYSFLLGGRFVAMSTLVYLIVSSVFMHKNNDRISVGFARHLSILPMRTWSLAGLQVGYSAALVLALVLGYRLLFASIPEAKNDAFTLVDDLLWRPAGWLTFTLAGYGVLWSMGCFRSWLRAIPLIVTVAILFAIAATGNTMFPAIAAGGLIASVVGAVWGREGRVIALRRPAIFSWAAAPDRRFASAAHAQVWYETRTRAWWLFACHGLCMCAGALFLAFDGMAKFSPGSVPEFFEGIVAMVFITFPYALGLCSLVIMGMDMRAYRGKAKAWVYTCPLSARDLAAARLKASGRAFAFHYVAMVILAAPFLMEGVPEIAESFQRSGYTWLGTVPGAALFATVGIAALGLLLWAAQYQLLNLSLMYLLLLVLPALVYEGMQGDFVSSASMTQESAVTLQTIFNSSAAVAWCLTALLIAVAWKRKLLGPIAALIMLATWGVCCALLSFTIGAAVAQEGTPEEFPGMIWIALAAFIPAFAFVLVPLNLHWQRLR